MTSIRAAFQNRVSLGELVRTLPARQLVLLRLAIFSMFMTIAFVFDIVVGGRIPPGWLALTAIASGAVSVVFTATSLSRRKLTILLLAFAYAGYTVVAHGVFRLQSVAPPGRLAFDAVGALVAVALGDTLFVLFMNVTATRYLRAQAELAVAHEIHRVLVPSIARTLGEYEFFGWSIASGEVGGDLLDLVDSDGRWLAYVADVSGHGVGAGIVMGMFKSALRTRAVAGGSIGAVLGDIQAALMPLKQPNMFVTVACVHGGAGADIECAVAGHHPILRIRAGIVEEMTEPQFAVGMFSDATFVSTRVECRRGDVLALLTDGLIEVFDSANRELGFEWVKATLGTLADRPLSDIADHLLTGARSHGTQLDDQTILLIRRGTG